jgi:hypothetical protein
VEMREEGGGYGWLVVIVFVGHVFELFFFFASSLWLVFRCSCVYSTSLQLTHISGLAFVRTSLSPIIMRSLAYWEEAQLHGSSVASGICILQAKESNRQEPTSELNFSLTTT